MNSVSMRISISKNSLILALFAALTVGVAASIQQLTKEPILEAQKRVQIAALSEIFPSSLYDNNLIETQITLNEPALGHRSETQAFLAYLNNQPAGIILQATAPDGYSGSIELLVGITAEGELSGVRVISHKETPGLGDKIERIKSDWITSFNNKSLSNTPESHWNVKKDGGEFDQFAGATITPRAVVKAVQRSLVYFDINKEALFALHDHSEVTP